MFNDSHAIQCDQYLLVCVSFLARLPVKPLNFKFCFTAWLQNPVACFQFHPGMATSPNDTFDRESNIIYIHEQMIFMDSAGPSLFYKLMAMIFPFACWLILVIIWLQQMYLYASMFLDHTTSKTSGLHQCLWGSLCSFVGLSFCPSPGAWYADAKKDSCTVLQMQHVLKKGPWARWLLNSLYVWVRKVSMIIQWFFGWEFSRIRYRSKGFQRYLCQNAGYAGYCNINEHARGMP